MPIARRSRPGSLTGALTASSRSARFSVQLGLANILFTRELARRLEGTPVTANCAHPGVVRSGFGRSGGTLLRVGLIFARPFLLSPERGASTIVYLATSPDVATATGGYYVKSRLREPSKAAQDQAAAQRLWELSEELTGLAPARPAGA